MGPWVASFCAIALCFSPWYLRSFTWDYVDGFAIDYIPRPGSRAFSHHGVATVFWQACAGFCFALAMNANLYALAIWGAFLPPWILIYGFQPWRRIATKAFAFFVGFIAAYAGLALAVKPCTPRHGSLF